jgi:hypothetical protein
MTVIPAEAGMQRMSAQSRDPVWGSLAFPLSGSRIFASANSGMTNP